MIAEFAIISKLRNANEKELPRASGVSLISNGVKWGMIMGLKYQLDEISEELLSSLSLEELEELADGLQDIVDDFDVTQHALKILINALYGALANKHFLLANPDLAAGITSAGRFFIRLLSLNLENTLQGLLTNKEPYVVYNDTDSVYYTIKPFVLKKFANTNATIEGKVNWADNFEKKIVQKVIQDTIAEFAELLNVMRPDVIGVEREIIADSAAFIAKKKYFARVRDMEGVRFPSDDPYIKIMGLEVARSSTPPWVKERLKESVNVILDRDENGVRKWRDEMKALFPKQPILDISMVAGISDMSYTLGEKGIPQGPKSAIAHNNWVESNNLQDEIEILRPGEKYKRCYLKTPNRFGTEVLSFEGNKIAKIIEEDGIFDYQLNFEKYFENPLENMVKSVGMDISNRPMFDEW